MSRISPGRCAAAALALLPATGWGAEGGGAVMPLTGTTVGMACVAIFIGAYLLVIAEEFIHLRKSKPVVVAAGLMWVLIGWIYSSQGDHTTVARAVRETFLEYAELLIFLLSAMTYINTMEERNVFHALRGWLVSSGLSLRSIFWVTGALAFCISPVADNLTTALIMAAVVMAVGGNNAPFVSAACISIVVAANAGGAFSPFGDITTLMVWQKGVIKFAEFFDLLIPAVVNWVVPAFFLWLAVPKGRPAPLHEDVAIKYGGLVIVALFLGTIVLTVAMHTYYNLPPFLGMMTGLGFLKLYSYHVRKVELRRPDAYLAYRDAALAATEEDVRAGIHTYFKPRHKPFDIFISIKRVEWDTLLFFYGVIMCVGGLGLLGYLALLSRDIYTGLGPTAANTLVGLLSALVDNIPVMYAVLTMDPSMSHGQWLLATLTAGVGGSLLSIGSAAGVALMGQARGVYTFFAHLKWTWAIALGYGLSIWVHLMLNARLM